MNTEELVESCKNTLESNLLSIILYGSKAKNEADRLSDVNVLVIVNRLAIKDLNSLMPITKKWEKAGNPPPLVMTESNIKTSLDVFPVEYMDIKAHHRILFGTDPFENVAIQTQHLRHQLEYELRGKLIQLRERYMETGGKPSVVAELLSKALATFAVLFQGVLRLAGADIPTKKEDTWTAIHQLTPVDVDGLQAIYSLRSQKSLPKDFSGEAYLDRLIQSVQSVINFVDEYKK